MGQIFPLLADRARSECARSMRAVGSTCTHSAIIEVKEKERPLTKVAILFSWSFSVRPSTQNPLWAPISQQPIGLLQLCHLWHNITPM